jgi:cytochrome c oxidase subunit III
VAVAEAPTRRPQAQEPTPDHPAMSIGMMGMYIFLASELMFFGSLFATYFYLYGSHSGWPAPGTEPVHWFPIPWVNTFILVTSGVTCHFAAEAMARDNRKRFFLLMVSTLVLGVLFEVGQGFEFLTAKIVFTDPNQFGTAFFTMTGFHGAHVLGGLIFLSLVLGRALKGQFNSQHHVAVAAATLYWHFVDVVWIFLFAVLYLMVTAV